MSDDTLKGGRSSFASSAAEGRLMRAKKIQLILEDCVDFSKSRLLA